MKTQDKTDLFKEHKDEYVHPKKPVLVEVGPAVYLAICGRGAPGGEEFTRRIGALYSMAYTIKMTRKFGGEQDYAVGKLEAQWWADGNECFAALPKERWNWKLMIRTPDFVAQEELDRAVAVLKKRGKTEPVDQVRLELIADGRCVQMLHVGPYEEEGKTMELMQKFAESQGCEFHGKHHEIYLSDPRRVEPAKLKTILRRQVRAKH